MTTLLPQRLLTDTMKGVPTHITHLPLHEIKEQQWNILKGDLPLPIALVKQSAVMHNSQWMQTFLAKTGALICPHGKTTMAPQLFERQLQDGAWGITVATLQQLRVCRAFNINRVMMANELVDPQGIEYVFSELEAYPDFQFYCLVDSVASVTQLATIGAQHTQPLSVMIECGYAGGRAGCRDLHTALAVAKAVHQAPCLRLVGVEGFEGSIHGHDEKDTLRLIQQYLNFVVETAEAIAEKNYFKTDDIILTAGGTAYYDLAIARLKQSRLRATVLTRSGCYLLHDSRYYDQHFQQLVARDAVAAHLKPGMQHAVEVWSYVQSLPEKGRAILNFGKRDASYDVTMPIPLYHYSPQKGDAPVSLDAAYSILKMDDQHAFLTIPLTHNLAVGDMIACGISHPCTTFDKWQWLPVVDDAYNVVDGWATYF